MLAGRSARFGRAITPVLDAMQIAAVNRRPVVSARAMALGHPRKGGATVFGVPAAKRFSPEWAAWANVEWNLSDFPLLIAQAVIGVRRSMPPM